MLVTTLVIQPIFYLIFVLFLLSFFPKLILMLHYWVTLSCIKIYEWRSLHLTRRSPHVCSHVQDRSGLGQAEGGPEKPLDGPPRPARTRRLRKPVRWPATHHAVTAARSPETRRLYLRYVFHSFSNSFLAHNPYLYKSPKSHTHTLILSILSKFRALLLQFSSTQGMNPNSISELCFNSFMNFDLYWMNCSVETLIMWWGKIVCAYFQISMVKLCFGDDLKLGE